MASTAFVFPGQGSQSVGMLADVGDRPLVAEAYAEASERLGYDLWKLTQEGPEEQLTQTEFTQPAILTASVALWRLAREGGAAAPHAVAGHSLGEYSALVAAGVLSLGDAAYIVQQRGRFMQAAVPVGVGSMAAILGLEDAAIEEICTAVSEVDASVQPANYNAPGQLVVAGHAAGVDKAVEACKEAGAKRATLLAVSAPFHSALMAPAAEELKPVLESFEFLAPSCKVVQNFDAQFCSDPDAIRANLIRQVDSAVLWSQIIGTLQSDGVGVVVECGPGKVLSGLNRRIDRSIESHNIGDAASLAATLDAEGILA